MKLITPLKRKIIFILKLLILLFYLIIFNKNVNFKKKYYPFNIIKIHNNKQHSTTKLIPKENRDLTDQREIDIIKQEIIKTMKKKANADEIQYDKLYRFQ